MNEETFEKNVDKLLDYADRLELDIERIDWESYYCWNESVAIHVIPLEKDTEEETYA